MMFSLILCKCVLGSGAADECTVRPVQEAPGVLQVPPGAPLFPWYAYRGHVSYFSSFFCGWYFCYFIIVNVVILPYVHVSPIAQICSQMVYKREKTYSYF